MYAALGDRQTQNEIRERNPKGVHCELLEVSENACSQCPKNPFIVEPLDEDLVDLWSFQIATATALLERVECGIVYGPHDLSYFEFRLLSIAKGTVASLNRAANIDGNTKGGAAVSEKERHLQKRRARGILDRRNSEGRS